MRYITGKEARILDINAAYLGVPKSLLMENAGRVVYEELIKIKDLKKKRLAIYCGTGNNGGDGFVCARHLYEADYDVEVFVTGEPNTPEASESFRVLKGRMSVAPVGSSTYDHDVVIDALLGTGIRGEVREPIRTIIRKINASKAYMVSVDIPSGLNEEGKGYAVRAGKVVTFHRPKKGLERFKTAIKDIGIPILAETHVGPGDVAVNITRRTDSHKGDNGRVLVVGGSEEYHGAPILSALGALHSGADLVHIAVPEGNYDVTRSYAPDFIVKKFPGKHLGDGGPWFPDGDYDAMVIGPGLGAKEETRRAIGEILKKTRIPAVVDADGIRAIADAGLRVNGVITPHSKEFQILSGKRLQKDDQKRKEMLLKESAKIGSVVLLKAPVDIIVSPDGRWKFNATGNEGMTVGGTGDVLAGVVGGLLVQGLDSFDAACCAAFINGAAGDELYSSMSFCFTASDLAYEIPYTIRRILEYGSA